MVGPAALQLVHGFYLPGVAPQGFKKNDPVVLKVNKLSSVMTQLPYEYSLPFCQPEKITPFAKNLGEVLRGDGIETPLYQFHMRVDEQCKVLCRIDSLSAAQATAFKEAINEYYKVHMTLDNLPVAMVRSRWDFGVEGLDFSTWHWLVEKQYERGYYVGFKETLPLKEIRPFGHTGCWCKNNNPPVEKFYLHNHLRFNILYNHDAATDLSRVVGVEVEAFSVKHEHEKPWDPKKPVMATCNLDCMISLYHWEPLWQNNINNNSLPPQPVEEGSEVVFTYDVKWTLSDIDWASRWDTYLARTGPVINHEVYRIHWFSIVKNVMIVFVLSGMFARIMLRTLYRDISKYNQLDTWGDATEETGWKLVHGDVFRPPQSASLLSAYAGVGVQIFGMLVITTVFVLLGFLSPANIGDLMTTMVLTFVFMGLLAGYAAARLYKAFRGNQWKQMTLRTAFMFPGTVFAMFLVLDLLVWGQKSSGAVVPFGTLVAICFLWFGVSVPLVFVGSYLGFKKPAPENPVRTNKIPRQIPEQPWYMHPLFSCLVGGVLPFGIVYTEFFYILVCIWWHQLQSYYLFGFLALAFVMMCITCAEITIVLCYFQLCSEGYHWWWRAYLTSGSTALYLFAWSTCYFWTRLDISKFVPVLLYFIYMSAISYGFFCLCGTIGFYAAYWFVTKIYGTTLHLW